MSSTATVSSKDLRLPVRTPTSACCALWTAVCLAGGLAACTGASVAQSPSTTVTGPTPATPVPLSAPTASASGSVSVMQATSNAASGSTVNTVNTTVTVLPPYSGSTPSGEASSAALSLTLDHALAMGMKFNLGAVNQSNAVLQAKGQRDVARSTLLPSLNTGISEVFERENLRTLGVSLPSIPESVQFNYFDARAIRLQQSVFDLVRLDNLHTANETLKANLTATRNTRDLVVLAVGGSYLQVLATEARITAAEAQVNTSRAIAEQAADRFSAGLSARIDSSRSRVQLGTEQQRLRSLQADLETQKLKLARIIGLPLGQGYAVADDFSYTPLTGITLETALQRASAGRSDLQSAASGVRAAEAGLKAAHAERLPNLGVNADFGAAGVTPSHHATGVYTVSGTLTIPLYEGGRIHGDIEQATAALQQRKAALDDARGQVDQDVRQSFIDLGSAADQVEVAKSNVDLAHLTLTQSRDRFAAGVADTVELVQAEQAVVQADDDYITAVFEHNLAKVSLARAMGNAEQTLPQLLRK